MMMNHDGWYMMASSSSSDLDGTLLHFGGTLEQQGYEILEAPPGTPVWW